MRNHFAIAVLLPLCTSAQTYYYINGIDVDPVSPTAQDVIAITLHGDLSSTGAYIVSAAAQVFGGVLQIDITAADPGGLAVLVPHDEVIAVGMLPAGGYQVSINGTNVSDNAANGDHLLNVDGGSWPACDSLWILSIQYAAFHMDQLVATVQNNSSELFDYPSFILFDANHDTIAVETVNFFGIGGTQDHVLVIGSGIGSGAITGTLELWTGFTQFHACTFPVNTDLCPPPPCSMVYVNITNTGGALVNATFDWTMLANGQPVGNGEIVMDTLAQMGTDSLCLPPGYYQLQVSSTPTAPGGQIQFGVTDRPFFGGDVLGASYVQNGGPNTLDVPFYSACNNVNAIAGPEAMDPLLVRTTSDAIEIERRDGSAIRDLQLTDVTGRTMHRLTGNGPRMTIITSDLPAGIYLLRSAGLPVHRILIIH
ncbi:MAG: T9SS type A sorting domain-containing protein [Flavobacteriales bacterium]|nr:T9SS type A sorting domain-containing protein [Flavobacteriales bacterium]